MASPNVTPIASAYEAPMHSHYAVPMPPPYVGQMGHYASSVKDYSPWSVLKLCCGWGLGGILPLIFSIMCKNNKNSNNYSGAQSMSKLALIFNILITIGGAISWLWVITYMSKHSAAFTGFHKKKHNI